MNINNLRDMLTEAKKNSYAVDIYIHLDDMRSHYRIFPYNEWQFSYGDLIVKSPNNIVIVDCNYIVKASFCKRSV